VEVVPGVHAWLQPDGTWWLNNADAILGEDGRPFRRQARHRSVDGSCQGGQPHPSRRSRTVGKDQLALASAASAKVRPVATPGTLPHCLKGVGGAPTRRTGRKPKYIQYEDFRPARREHAPDAAP
jgi:hypothetical protein